MSTSPISLRCRVLLLVLPIVAAMAWTASCGGLSAAEPSSAVIVAAGDASFGERLAAREVRRYVYVRSGRLLPLVDRLPEQGEAIVVGVRSRLPVGVAENASIREAVAGLRPEEYLVRTTPHRGVRLTVLVGGDPTGALYAAYRYAEALGVRFAMHGDIVPDAPWRGPLPAVDELGKPLFDRRGIQPFHDFPEGPDWWSTDGYKAIFGQLVKLRMNFFGLHTYPEGGVGPEPLTWIGRKEDLAGAGGVKAAYPSRHYTTVGGAWGYLAMKTRDYVFGSDAMYDRDDYGADYMRGMTPWPKTPEDQVALFGRMGAVARDAFGHARRLGIKTCIGTETPLTIPTPVKQRLKAQGKNPDDPKVVQEVYEAMFQRIAETHPLDYFWFWTPEGWTWETVHQKQLDATMSDFRAAMAAAKNVRAPFALATCGWVLGPPQDPSLFDRFLPKDMPMSCINRQVGNSPVEQGFAKVTGRPKWAIPWMEDDPALTSVQLWAGRMRKDAADALAYGCTGLLGIHWRTRILDPTVAALADAAWSQKAWNPAVNPGVVLPREPEGPVGGQCVTYANNPIAGTDDDPLYQSVRYNTGGYLLDVPNGEYTVTLKFCEPHYDRKQARVFGVKIQGKQEITGLDIFDRVGKNKALDYTYKNVRVSGGRLAIEFTFEVEFPCIAAIVVEGVGATRKINCGGPAYRDYAADWPPSTQGGNRLRYLPTGDFYADWAKAQFGAEAAGPIGALMAKIDCYMPRPSDWTDGPGGVKPDPRAWAVVEKDYAFVDQFDALRPRVQGPGNLERFDYWASNFRYLRALAKSNCTWHLYNQAIAKVKAEKDAAAQRRLAEQRALPLRKQLVAEMADVFRHLHATVTTPGELGTVTNLQQRAVPIVLTQPGEELAKLLGQPLPADALPTRQYVGPQRLFVPAVRTSLVAGEPLVLDVIVLGAQPTGAALHWRLLGQGDYAKIPLRRVARGVHAVTIPADAIRGDFEYYVEAGSPGGALRFPATAPRANQTVVVVGP
jgi:hypothetical protein